MNKESIKDKITNSLLYVKAKVESFIPNQPFGTDEPDTDEMMLMFQDNFNEFDPDVWRIGQLWGTFHPNALYQYYGEDSVCIKDYGLVLKETYSPKDFTLENGTVVSIPYSVGLVSSRTSFEYGFFKFTVSLPNGKGLWPAVWFNGVDNWPPEIDVIEAYSDEKGKYGQKLQTNFFFGPSTGAEMAGPRNNPVFNPLAVLVMSCWWTEDFIKIYYNGYLVRVITSKNILKWFKGQRMSIVLNNAIRQEYSADIKDQTTEFQIHQVKAWNTKKS
jgi:beta-glucanase (GH16 family)